MVYGHPFLIANPNIMSLRPVHSKTTKPVLASNPTAATRCFGLVYVMQHALRLSGGEKMTIILKVMKPHIWDHLGGV
jgi:hypothetical protein